MAKKLIWQALDWTGLDYFTIKTVESGFVAEGRLVGALENIPFTFQYQIRINATWQVRELIVQLDVTNLPFIHLITDGSGNWQDSSGATLPALQGCIDVDLTLSPVTNTLPIRRLQFVPEKPELIEVAYIDLPQGKISSVEQIYTQLSATTYRFEQPAIGFTADILVDEDGLVIDYPDLFRRI